MLDGCWTGRLNDPRPSIPRRASRPIRGGDACRRGGSRNRSFVVRGGREDMIGGDSKVIAQKGDSGQTEQAPCCPWLTVLTKPVTGITRKQVPMAVSAVQ